MKNYFVVIILVLVLSCSGVEKEQWDGVIIEQESSSLRLAFGSCAHSYDTIKIFNSINARQPALWIWLGDIVYGDTHDMSVLREKYDLQKAKPEYQVLLAQSKVIGTWDDHDYGINDGGKYYPMKNESKAELLRFLDTDPLDPLNNREGAYSAYDLKLGDNLIRVLLLDTRYFRDTLTADTLTTARYLINESGDILGEQQWSWLEEQLSAEDANLFIVGSSIELIAEEQGFEKWANFPAARKRFFETLKFSGSTPVFVISGDRHIAELSKIEFDYLEYPLFDFTASGLTHTWGVRFPEENKYRVDSLIVSKNYGLLDIDFTSNRPVIDLKVIDEEDRVLLSKQIRY